ncbi:hypothetical protein [Streptomyces sp. NPDC051909]|uniref:hypothetical protein n=1 Tax=Streptomyces sp. NPDC051909 TaxID=3154944 RepID=UPI0034418311
MIDLGGGSDTPVRRSRLADYADPAFTPRDEPAATPPWSPPPPTPAAPPGGVFDAEAEGRRREFAAILELFRETAVLVPRRDGSWLTVDFGGVRWILAFSDESALVRYALARGEGGVAWEYETVLGARLLDAAVPGAGVPCGVALDAADGAEHAVLLPPVAGIVPDTAAVDEGTTGGVR